MSVFTFVWHRSPARMPAAEHKPARDTRGYAGHLRGEVRIGRGGYFYMSVVNTTTGETVESDYGCIGLARAFEHAEFHTAVARAVWMSGITQKSVKAHRRKKRAA